MNKVSERCGRDSVAKFSFASKKMFNEVKLIKTFLYILAIIPIVLQLIPAVSANKTLSLLYTLISFSITIITEVFSSFLNMQKEKAILLHQLYESEATGSTFSKIEYDREMTNELNELAIRKGLPKMRKAKAYPVSKVPDEISDDYSYLYLCRLNASKTNYLSSRMFILYTLQLIVILLLFGGAIFYKQYQSTDAYLKLIIGFYPLVIPIIRDCAACKKCETNCIKICADIDNFFADGDASVERLARFYYYVQNIEFEMFVSRPTQYKKINFFFKRGLTVLADGVTVRFLEAINELRGRSEGLIGQAKGMALITKVDYDIEELKRKQLEREKRKQATERRAKEKEALERERLLLLVQAQNQEDEVIPTKNTSKSTPAKKPIKTAPKKKESTTAGTKKPAAKITTKKTTTKK